MKAREAIEGGDADERGDAEDVDEGGDAEDDETDGAAMSSWTAPHCNGNNITWRQESDQLSALDSGVDTAM